MSIGTDRGAGQSSGYAHRSQRRDGSINAKRAMWAEEGVDALIDRMFDDDTGYPSPDAQLIAAAILVASGDIKHAMRKSETGGSRKR